MYDYLINKYSVDEIVPGHKEPALLLRTPTLAERMQLLVRSCPSFIRKKTFIDGSQIYAERLWLKAIQRYDYHLIFPVRDVLFKYESALNFIHQLSKATNLEELQHQARRHYWTKTNPRCGLDLLYADSHGNAKNGALFNLDVYKFIKTINQLGVEGFVDFEIENFNKSDADTLLGSILNSRLLLKYTKDLNHSRIYRLDVNEGQKINTTASIEKGLDCFASQLGLKVRHSGYSFQYKRMLDHLRAKKSQVVFTKNIRKKLQAFARTDYEFTNYLTKKFAITILNPETFS